MHEQLLTYLHLIAIGGGANYSRTWVEKYRLNTNLQWVPTKEL
jgi:hypothetical protein